MKAVSIVIHVVLVGLIFMGTSGAEDIVSAEPPGLHALRYGEIQEGVTACDDLPTSQLCALNVIWGAGDVTGDGKLSAAEVNRLLRILAGGIAYDEYLDARAKAESSTNKDLGVKPPKNDEVGAVLGTAAIGAVLTQGLFANLDYDDNGLLSRSEITFDTDLLTIVASVEKQREQLPARVMEALQILQLYFGGR